jgi:hypothetical protein
MRLFLMNMKGLNTKIYNFSFHSDRGNYDQNMQKCAVYTKEDCSICLFQTC